LASDDAVARAAEGLKARNIAPLVVDSGAEALEEIKKLIPAGASVMNGSSRTLEEIGFIDHLKSGTHGWKNLHADILAEKDPAAQALLRRQALISDWYLGSVHALAETGEFLIASNTGSQLPHVVYSSPNVIFVVSTKKITSSLPEAYGRLTQHVFPLEDRRMKDAGAPGSRMSKILTFTYEAPYNKRNVRMILVKEALGF